MKTIQVKIEGMSCDACIANAQRALEAVAGVRSAHVNLQSGVATVESDDSILGNALVGAVENIGYDAQLVSEN